MSLLLQYLFSQMCNWRTRLNFPSPKQGGASRPDLTHCVNNGSDVLVPVTVAGLCLFSRVAQPRFRRSAASPNTGVTMQTEGSIGGGTSSSGCTGDRGHHGPCHSSTKPTESRGAEQERDFFPGWATLPPSIPVDVWIRSDQRQLSS